MLPVTSVIPAPIPEHLFVDHDLSMLFAALLVALALSLVFALIGAASADRSAQADEDLRFFEQLRRRGSQPPARRAKDKRRPLAA